MTAKALMALGATVVAMSVVLGDAPVAADAADDVALAAETDLTGSPPKDRKDLALAADPRLFEGRPVVAANPKSPNLMVLVLATGGRGDGRCLAYRSSDAGRTWSQPVALPNEPGVPNGSCGVADIAYAPDGKRIYAAYAVFDDTDPSTGILVSGSDDNGATWHSPTAALERTVSVAYGRPRIATPLRQAGSNWLYLVARRFPDIGPSTSIVFSRSADRGMTWSAQTLALDFDGCCIIGGHSVAGGLGGEVLVAWSNIYDDAEPSVIEVVRSQNHGATFGPRATAASDSGLFGSPNVPEVKIGDKGVAHIAYTRVAPPPSENHDIGYIWSPGPPYTAWSKPVTVSDDGLPGNSIQSAPSLAIQKCGTSTFLHLVWQDARLSPAASPNNLWDVFYARKIAKPGAGWSKNIRVSGKSSLNYFGGGIMQPDVAASQGRLFAAWTDRRDTPSTTDPEADVYGSGILSGVTCP